MLINLFYYNLRYTLSIYKILSNFKTTNRLFLNLINFLFKPLILVYFISYNELGVRLLRHYFFGKKHAI